MDLQNPLTEEGLRAKPRLIALGAFFFRQRSWTPIPFILFLALCRAKESNDLVTWLPGIVFLALGEWLRLWGVAVVGKESRTRSTGVARLVTTGPYAHVRNPLYLGNLFLTLGAVCVSELLWFIPIAIALYAIQYVPIVLWEEHVLGGQFGAEYAAYCRKVPRWIPRWRRPDARASHVPYQWRASFWSERSTFGAIAVLLLLMVAKEDLPHLFKYFRKHSMDFSSAHQFAPKSFAAPDPSSGH